MKKSDIVIVILIVAFLEAVFAFPVQSQLRKAPIIKQPSLNQEPSTSFQKLSPSITILSPDGIPTPNGELSRHYRSGSTVYVSWKTIMIGLNADIRIQMMRTHDGALATFVSGDQLDSVNIYTLDTVVKNTGSFSFRLPPYYRVKTCTWTGDCALINACGGWGQRSCEPCVAHCEWRNGPEYLGNFKIKISVSGISAESDEFRVVDASTYNNFQNMINNMNNN